MVLVVLRQYNILDVVAFVLILAAVKCIRVGVVVEDVELEEWNQVVEWHARDGRDECVHILQFEII